ncbi:S8 family serine peptidase [Plantactinospora sp. B6F1]|uniref:S8 family serine peptidase n=1 Tax=Plantactinospora sp. B6F1 TaxID=3158971 RepID=UPI0032D8BAA3
MYHSISTLRRTPFAVLAVVALAAGLLTAGPAAYADPPSSSSASDQTGQDPGVLTLDGVAPGPKTITLITGDQVTLRDAGTGSDAFAVDVDAAPRPDGHIPRFEGTGDDNAFYLYPDDARPAVESGMLDRDLFNLTYLAENGYTDAEIDSLPVIASYPEHRSTRSLAASADALPASKPTVELSSINSSGLAVAKDDAADFWSAIRPTTVGPGVRARALSTGLSKLWLDHRVEVSLAESVPMIGAPAAWGLGLDGTGVTVAVLDTGYDENHPDLAGKVVAAKGFDLFGDTSTHDGNGHGTHVASTIAGSGAASDGRHKGVAPGVDLMIGKVLRDNGSGLYTDVIAGMEWAATNGADIISMSLGASPIPDDPTAQAVEELTESTGALFVIAAGNDGPAEFTIGSPGIADSALTVAAVDKSDQLADFSSRGPLLEGGLKPDIAAPGVAITAARAKGTSPGVGDDPYYVGMRGTSMATPHVSGAAAILAQKHPDWTHAELKTALMSTSVDGGYSVYQQGAGRVDIARAVTRTVFATTPNADFGIVPADAAPATRQITYRNTGDADVTLTLAPSLRKVGGDPVPADTLTVDGQLTVPAGGTATATVTLTSAHLDVATYTGAVVATDETTGTSLSTPVGFRRQPPMHTLTVNVLGRDGQPAYATLVDAVDLIHQLGSFGQFGQWVSPGVWKTLVPVGATSVAVAFHWIDESHRNHFGYLLDPEVEVTGDTEITLDARTLQKFTFRTSRPAEVSPSGETITMVWQRTVTGGATHFGYVNSANFYQYWATPTEPVEVGDLQVYTGMPLAAPEVTMRVEGVSDLDLHPMTFPHNGTEFMMGYTGELFTGTRTLKLVDAGLGRPEDIAGRDLTGALALLEMDSLCAIRIDRMHNLRDAGAAGVLAWPSHEVNTSGCWNGPTIPLPVVETDVDRDRNIGIPYASVAPGEGRALRDRLTRKPIRITVTGTPVSPYVYKAVPFEIGQVPDSLTYDLTDGNVATEYAEYHATEPTTFTPRWLSYGHRAVQVPIVFSPPVDGPATRTHYVGPLSDRVVHTSEPAPYNMTKINLFTEPVRTHTTWNGTAAVPGSATYSDALAKLTYPDDPQYHRSITICSMCREGDKFYPVFQRIFGTGEYEMTNYIGPDLTHLYQGDREIPIETDGDIPGFTMPSEPGDYRLTLHDPGLRTRSEWTFHSEGTANQPNQAHGLYCPTSLFKQTNVCRAEPLVYATYDLGSRLGLDNTVKAPGAHWFKVNAYHAPSRTPMPKIAGVRMWYSQDDGRTWKPAQVKNKGNGQFEVKAVYKPKGGTGAVSLKLKVWDKAGNTLTQTTTRAFDLRYRHHDPIKQKAQ